MNMTEKRTETRTKLTKEKEDHLVIATQNYQNELKKEKKKLETGITCVCVCVDVCVCVCAYENPLGPLCAGAPRTTATLALLTGPLVTHAHTHAHVPVRHLSLDLMNFALVLLDRVLGQFVRGARLLLYRVVTRLENRTSQLLQNERAQSDLSQHTHAHLTHTHTSHARTHARTPHTHARTHAHRTHTHTRLENRTSQLLQNERAQSDLSQHTHAHLTHTHARTHTAHTRTHDWRIEPASSSKTNTHSQI